MTPKWIINFTDALKSLTNIPEVWVEAGLYVGLGMSTFWLTFFGNDEAAKFIAPTLLFWIKFFIGTWNSVFLALKMFRSTAFAGHKAEKKIYDETTRIIKEKLEGK